MSTGAAPLRIGIIGLGQMGRRHLRVLSMLKGVDLTFLHDVDRGAAQALGSVAGVPAVDDLDAALGSVDAVVIATPTTTHDEYVRRCAGRVGHLFVEKPLTDRLETSVELARFVRSHGTHVQVGFIERFNPAVAQLRPLLEASKQVVNVDFVRTARLSARIKDVDVVTDLMIHDIDLAVYLNGPVRTVDAYGVATGTMIDFACAALKHENGRFSRIQASRITDKKMRLIQATCRDMVIDCELLRKEIVVSREADFVDGALYRITSTSETLEVPPQEALLTELQAFIAGCRGENRGDAAGIDDAVAAMAICADIRNAIYGAEEGTGAPKERRSSASR